MNLSVRFLVLSALSIAIANGAAVLAGLRGPDPPILKEERCQEVCEAIIRTQAIFDQKSRTPAQKKIDSQLLYTLMHKRGETRGIPTERTTFEADEKGRILVDVTARVTPRVTSHIRKLGGVVVSEDQRYHTIRARLALEKLEALANLKDVSFIAPAAQAMNNRGNNSVRPN